MEFGDWLRGFATSALRTQPLAVPFASLKSAECNSALRGQCRCARPGFNARSAGRAIRSAARFQHQDLLFKKGRILCHLSALSGCLISDYDDK